MHEGRLEVHEHCFIRGPRSRWAAPHGRVVHSHEGGDVPHTHPDTGPGSYTIDKDERLRATGLKGGGRKKFTAAPTGEQFPTIPRTPEENAFEVIVCDPPAAGTTAAQGTGPGEALPLRMVLAFGMRPVVIDGGKR